MLAPGADVVIGLESRYFEMSVEMTHVTHVKCQKSEISIMSTFDHIGWFTWCVSHDRRAVYHSGVFDRSSVEKKDHQLLYHG